MSIVHASKKSALVVATLLGVAAGAQAQTKVVYVASNNVAEGENSIIAYRCSPEGKFTPHPSSPFLTGGTGIDNDTNGKLGPNDNDTPVIVDDRGKRLFTVNGHSDSIAVFDIHSDGSLSHVTGSPFDSMGIGPVSLSLAGDVLLVANRNEDPQRLDLLREASASYAAFEVGEDGSLDFLSKIELDGGGKPTQVMFAPRNPKLAFGNQFQVDVDFDGDGEVSRQWSRTAQVRGGIDILRLDEHGKLELTSSNELPETADPAPEVPSVPLGLWFHPKKNLVYAGLVTRNQLGVFHYTDAGELHFVSAVPNSGQDICWLKVNEAGTRLYAINNLPREDHGDGASTLTVFDLAGERAEKPVELQRIELPKPGRSFFNNRNAAQPGSTAFQLELDESEGLLYVVAQRIDQTEANTDPSGNFLHVLSVGDDGKLALAGSRDLGKDGVRSDSRPQGIACVALPAAR